MSNTGIIWPRSVFPPRTISVNKRGMSVVGPSTLTGRNQAASVDAGYWVFSFRRIAVGTPEKVKAWRALSALIEGASNLISIPVYDAGQIGEYIAGASVPFKNDDNDPVYFSDGSGFAGTDPYLAMNVGEAAIGATSITIDFGAAPEEIVGGEYFSVRDRLYVIKGVIARVGDVYELAIWPRVREAIEDDVIFNFTDPRCLVRLQSDMEMDLDLDIGRLGFPDVNFIEAIDAQ